MLSHKQLKRKAIFRSLRMSMNLDLPPPDHVSRKITHSSSLPKIETVNTFISTESPSIPATASLSDFCSIHSSSLSSRSWKTDIPTVSSKESLTLIANQVKAIDISNSLHLSIPSSTSATSPIKRKISFCMKVRVCLIPTRKELAIVSSNLWWTLGECESFKKDAYFEIREFIDIHRCSVKDAMMDLYQPIEEYHPPATVTSLFAQWIPIDLALNLFSPSPSRQMSSASLNSFNNANMTVVDRAVILPSEEKEEEQEEFPSSSSLTLLLSLG